HASAGLVSESIASAAALGSVVEVVEVWASTSRRLMAPARVERFPKGPRMLRTRPGPPAKGAPFESFGGSGCQVLVDEVPVDEVVEDDVDELGPGVAVVDVVGVLPHVDRPQRLLAVLEGQVG